MVKNIKFFWEVLKETFIEWNKSSASDNSASLAYYAIFSIPGLLIIIIWIAGYFFGQEAIQGEISSQISGLMGSETAKSVEGMVTGALIDKENIIMKIVGIGSLVFGSTTLFFQLQKSLNNLWDVEAAPKKAWEKFILDRANSLGMILILGFLLMITMILSSAISLFNNFITRYFGIETYLFIEIINFGIGFGVVMLLFSLMFKMLPDVEISWKPVWRGAFLTSILFTAGKFLLSLYFSEFKPTSTFGTAGTIILIMLWINYSCMIVFFGVEFTKIYSYKKGYKIVPSKHAKWNSAKLYEEEHEKNSDSYKPDSKTTK
ncbi:ribonuclease BN [Chryseobacterium sp. FH2]|uniref:YihY/virulence factor BrkB family protein n=1 Tax=Chryseobacterium sp. FH2 TaxID=1674291 RepID=UPI00065AD094|nr:YihY/virulence factor BrkB family protein [Chryseobacterium sp. FH2]KMQ68619.1 ribonuclease BN [Chryseobacterium sp. FH2]